MDYQEFLDFIEENILDCYKELLISECGDDISDLERKAIIDRVNHFEVNLTQVTKNNGIVLDAIAIYQQGERISPNIYLKPFYDSYLMGKPLDFVMTEIAYQHRREKENADLEVCELSDYNAVSDRIVIRLINYNRNQEMLKDCPHTRYLDLAITFRYMVEESAVGMASILITNHQYKKWGVELDELYALALNNTMRLYPWRMDSLSDIMFECFEKQMMERLSDELLEEMRQCGMGAFGVALYVLTNQSKVFGASCMLYDQVIHNFAKAQDANLYILPSSVHEVMLVPEVCEVKPEYLKDILVEANKTSVGLIDLLSDAIYYYDRSRGDIVVMDI